MSFKVKGGVYPTMITPYKNGEIDYGAVEKLVEWYWKQGCDGIFAACQSSEIMFMSLEERVKLTRTVIAKAKALADSDKSREPMMIVASGHISDSFEEQVRELNSICAEKPDALILISNRMDIENTTDDKWIEDTERLMAELPEDMPLGMYECPKPYKRLLSDRMIKWCAETGRFHFIKDTCGDAPTIKRRVEICKGSNLKIFNANGQTMLESYRDGAYGYCGVMANFHPALYSRLLKEENEVLQGYLALSAMIEALTYPCCAKYYLNKYEGVEMPTYARSADENNFTDYQKSCIDQFALLNMTLTEKLFG
ncbi:MAG: dihydrodipicolinate synthase family protein [Clostridia bacterium]|nr:dihydrodipicolinate synthase family protein [Clostridia bacterium]